MAPLFDHLEEVDRALDGARTTEEAGRAVEEASPAADQLVADIEAVTPPPELSGAHEAIVAVAARIQADLGELDRVGGHGAGPIIASLAQQIRRQLGTLRETILGAPAEAREAGGLGARIEHLEELRGRITGGLRRLRDQFGVPVTVPET